MKRTDLEKRERELRRVEKRAEGAVRRESDRSGKTVGNYIDSLFSIFRYDQNEIFNTTDDIDVLEIIENMKEDHPPKQWDNILRKAIKKTKVTSKDKAFDELKLLVGE